MKPKQSLPATGPDKSPTGIAGFDEIAGGGLPSGRTTLLSGGPGSGKTIFALQFLAYGAFACNEPGIFVAFEEAAVRILSNAGSFGWKLPELREQGKLFFIDAQPIQDQVESGNFDFGGLLAVLEAQAVEMGARRIVFDALDILLVLLPDEAARRREVHRLHEWLLAHDLTGVITAKAGGDAAGARGGQPFGFMQFMVDCAAILNNDVLQGVSQRTLRVQKFRGSGFDENESPFIIGRNGIEVGVARTLSREDSEASLERLSSGVPQLDEMLGGGIFRCACVLITGTPGSAKTTLSAAFAEAACRRGERTMLVSFDSDSSEVIRNLNSVGIRLEPHIRSGILRVVSARTFIGSAGAHLVRIKTLAKEHAARILVIDPVFTLTKASNALNAYSVAELLIDWAKADDITLVSTSLHNESEGAANLDVSTLADTWIHLNLAVNAGERKRDLSIIKSRGTAHSHAIRKLLLSDTGVALGDIEPAILEKVP